MNRKKKLKQIYKQRVKAAKDKISGKKKQPYIAKAEREKLENIENLESLENP